jgi:protein gp37
MAENSDIAWTDNTFNGWMGCTRKSEGCAGCYANDICVHFKHTEAFGPDCTRIRTKDWSKPRAWDRKAKRECKPTFVFAFSMADAFDDHPSIQQHWRDEFWALVKATPNLIWLVLTKRPENFRLLPADWGDGYPNVWLGVTVENQRRSDERIPMLRALPAAKRFVSVEPMLGPVAGVDGLDWVICGGESGSRFREMKREWVVALRDECAAKGAAFFLKQWAAHHPAKDAEYPPTLDGAVWHEIPVAIEKVAASGARPADAAPAPFAPPVRAQRLLAHHGAGSGMRDSAQIACQGDRQFEEDKPRRKNHDLHQMLDDASGAMHDYAGKISAASSLDNAHGTVVAVYSFAYHSTVVDPETFQRMNTNGAGKPKVRPPSVKLAVKGYQEFYQAVKFIALTMRKRSGKGKDKPAIPEKTLQRYAKVCCWLALEKVQPENGQTELRNRTITAKETGIEALFDKLAGKPEPRSKRSTHVIGFERDQLLCLERVLLSSSGSSDPAFPRLCKTISGAVASLPILPETSELGRAGEELDEDADCNINEEIWRIVEAGDGSIISIREHLRVSGASEADVERCIKDNIDSGALFRANGCLTYAKKAIDALFETRYFLKKEALFEELDWDIPLANALLVAGLEQELISIDGDDNVVRAGYRARRKRRDHHNPQFWVEMLFDATPDCDCLDACSCEKDWYGHVRGSDSVEEARKFVRAAKHRASNFSIYAKTGDRVVDRYEDSHGDGGELNRAYDQWLRENYDLVEEG